MGFFRAMGGRRGSEVLPPPGEVEDGFGACMRLVE